MSAATMPTTDLLAGPVLIIRPSIQGHVITRGQNDYNLAVRLSEPAIADASVAQCNLTILTAGGAVELLDSADATWEDAEWQ
jgi:hypothetical protein